jgi:hypothetical protein
MYQVGDLEFQQPSDPVFATYEEAIEKAINQSWLNKVVAVWELPEGDVCALVYCRQVYEPS